MIKAAALRIYVPPQISDVRRARNIAMMEVGTAFCNGCGLRPYQRVPQERSRTDAEDHIGVELSPYYQQQQITQRPQVDEEDRHEEYDQPPQKRQIPNSFYGSTTARFGILPAAALCTLSHLAHLGVKSIAVGVHLSRHVPRVCKDIPRYVRDVQRAGVVRDVFEMMDIPGEHSGVGSVMPKAGQHAKRMVDAATQTSLQEVDPAILKRPMKEGRGCGTIFTPFSDAEQRALRPRKQDVPNAKTRDDLSRQHSEAQSRAQPTPTTTRCPLCHFDSPFTSTFCTTCLTPYRPGPGPKSRAQGIVSYDKSPNTYTSPIDG